MIELVLASANPDKVAEITAILGAVPGVALVPRPDWVPDVVEDGDTLVDNARLKARALVSATGQAAVADDTGLEVDALGGAPGVYSARFAGEAVTYEQNVALLIDRLREAGAATPELRRARFRTVALVALPDGTDFWVDGEVTGVIALAPVGRSGFGYDPIFIPDDGDGRTFAEMSPDEKHRVSHRGRAFRALADRLSSAD